MNKLALNVIITCTSLGIMYGGFKAGKNSSSMEREKLQNSYDSLKTIYNSFIDEYENYEEKFVKPKFGCHCPPKIGLEENPLKLIGSYDYNNDGNLDCIYQDSTKKTYLYEYRGNGNGVSLIEEINFPNKLYKKLK